MMHHIWEYKADWPYKGKSLMMHSEGAYKTNQTWSTSELRVRLAPLNRFKPPSKIFYWPFQGGTSFVDLLCFCSVLCLLCLCACLFICALWSPARKGLTSWLSFVVSTLSLSLSHWYPGSGVVLDCIDSWSLHPYLLYRGKSLMIQFEGEYKADLTYKGKSLMLHYEREYKTNQTYKGKLLMMHYEGEYKADWTYKGSAIPD